MFFTFDSCEEMAEAIKASGYKIPRDRLKEGMDYDIVKAGAPRKTIRRVVIGPYTVAPETAAAIDADRR